VDTTGAVLAEYGGTGLTGIAPSLVGAAPNDWLPEPVRDARSVVLLLLDGLGWNAIDPELTPVLSGLVGGSITTVAPSTTAAALTSLTTGLPPSRHGIVGFRMRVNGGVLNTLAWKSTARRPPDVFDVQRHAAFLGREVPVVTKSEFRRTQFTEAQLRGTRFVGWGAVSTLVEHCHRLVAEGERLVYAYYPGVDTVAHEFGLADRYYRAELRAADALVGAILDVLPESAALLVTSDHGQVDVPSDGWLSVDDLEPMIEAQAGDARFRYLHAKPGAAADLADAAKAAFGRQAWVLTREELFASGWLGPRPEGPIGNRVGDVVLAARDLVAFVDPALPGESGLRSMHGSVTTAEMQVPLVAGRGRAR
jgi:hypothetical protein